jgi:hypothetical protein
MDVGLIVLVVLVLVLALGVGLGPTWRRVGKTSEDEMRAVAPGADVDRQFKRPRDEGNLL